MVRKRFADDEDDVDYLEINKRETLTGLDYAQFMSDVIKSRNDPVWFAKNILEIDLFPKQEEILYEYYQHKYDSNLNVKKKLILPCGMRGGKTVTASVIGIYEFFEVISHTNPAEHFKLLKNQEIFITAVATSKQLAQDGIFANCRNHLEENEWFNQWFDLHFTEGRISQRDRHTHMQVLGSWATTAVGRSNKCVIFDELALFEKTEGKRGATEIYTRLSNSTMTFGLHGKVVAISSPQSNNDIIMSLYRAGLNEPQTVAKLYPTWIMNPKYTEEDLREECKFDMNRFYRDFACQPSAGGGVQFPDGVKFDRSLTNVLENLHWHDIEAYQSRVMAIDPAVKKDGFGIATGYMDNNGITIDGVCAIYKGEDQSYISPRDIWEFIKEASMRLNVYTLVFDTWMYVEVIEKAEQELGINVVKHIVNADDYDRWLEMQNAEHQYPLRVVYNPYLEREVDNLTVQQTPTGKKRVDHPKVGTGKDIADCVCNIIWYFTNNELEELEDATPIGRGTVVY